MNENMITTINQAIDSVSKVTDLFYQQKIKEGYQQFEAVLDDITNAVEAVFSYKAEHPDFEFDEERLVNTLKEALEAMEQKDSILMSDILQFDLSEQFQCLLS